MVTAESVRKACARTGLVRSAIRKRTERPSFESITTGRRSALGDALRTFGLALGVRDAPGEDRHDRVQCRGPFQDDFLVRREPESVGEKLRIDVVAPGTATDAAPAVPRRQGRQGRAQAAAVATTSSPSAHVPWEGSRGPPAGQDRRVVPSAPCSRSGLCSRASTASTASSAGAAWAR